MKKILIIGATSAIAEATARLWAKEGDRLYLLARNEERLKSLASDLLIRGAESVHCGTLDANECGKHEAVLDAAIDAMQGIDTALVAYGTLGDQKACEKDFHLTLQELNTNAISVISLLTHLANRFESQQRGTIAVIGSVAGDRGRQSNYVYGTAKGAVSIFLEGLRNRLYKAGVNVLTIKPGFVDTPMTADFEKGLLWTTPDQIAAGIRIAVTKQKSVVYLPVWWAMIMFLIRAIPDNIFRKLKL